MDFKRLAKAAILRGVCYSGAEWLRDCVRAAQNRLPAAILTFHRVTDQIPEDALTVSTARFRWMLRLLHEHYSVLSLTELLDCLQKHQLWPRRAVTITFDDGYRDNFEFAAPILAEYGMPATFFVATGLMGTGRVMFWDEHLRGRVSWMEWGHVRELHRQGFEIGSHTVHHADLGRVSAAEAWVELTASKAELEDKLGAQVSLFAYPFGQPGNITEENRALVRKAGYRCCCSCHGGFVQLGDDPYRLQRLPLNNWYATPDELHFELRQIAPQFWRRRMERRKHHETHTPSG